MNIPKCKCGRDCEKSDKSGKHFRKKCWKCRQYYGKERNYRERHLKYSRKLKNIVIDKYGGKCNCCGESIIEFLTIDHVYNDGAKERKNKKMSCGASTYRFIIKNNFPKNYQVLCWNCNCGRQLNNGVCPHNILNGRNVALAE